MPDVSQAINAEYIAPGFLFVQVLYLLKVSFVRQRSDFEKIFLSVLLDLELTQRLTFEVYLLAIALVGGLVIGLLNQLLFFEDEEVTED
jgi:hypothetical protein